MSNHLLYQKLNVPMLDLIQQEALDYIQHHSEIRTENLVEEEYFNLSIDNFPILKSFLVPRVNTRITEIGLVAVPPGFETTKHIDGLRKDEDNKFYNRIKETVINHPDFDKLDISVDIVPPIATQYVMMVPIVNYEQTISHWYDNNDVSDDNEIIRNFTRELYPYSFFISFVKPEAILTPVGSTNIDCITFIKTSIFHNVINQGSKTRLAFAIRFAENRYYESLEEIFKHQDLL